MSEDELNKFANDFIHLWQENFSKAIADQKIMEYMMQAAGNMQQFYDKNNQSSAAANAGSSGSRNDELPWGSYLRRIDELERRVESLEAAAKKTGGSGKPKRKK